MIIGSGCAGLTAAIYAARANLNPLVIEGNQPGGQLITTSEIENFPGFPQGIDGFQLIDNLRQQASRFGARFESEEVQAVDFSKDYKILKCSGTEIHARSVIIATGAKPRMTGVPGEAEYLGGKGVSTCATCDGAFYRDVPIAVIGGGDSAAEEALFLTHFASKVYMIHRRDTLRASSIMASRVLKHPKIEMVWNAVPFSIEADEQGLVGALLVRDVISNETSKITVKGVFIAIGHIPNTRLFKGILDMDENGYFIPCAGSQVRTKIEGVFIAGDCADHQFRQAITAAGMGAQAAIAAERWIAENLTHHAAV